LISVQQNQHDVLFARVIATNYLWCTKCPPKSLPKVPKNPSSGISSEEIKQWANHSYDKMEKVARYMIDHIGWKLVEEIKTARIWQGLKVHQLHMWDVNSSFLWYIRSTEVVREKCSGREGGVYYHGNKNMVIGQSASCHTTSFFVHLLMLPTLACPVLLSLFMMSMISNYRSSESISLLMMSHIFPLCISLFSNTLSRVIDQIQA